MNKKIVVLLLALLLPTPAFANEPTPVPSSNSYTPPVEASNGVGGWAVVNPETNQVCGVIVATIETFNAWNGLMPDSYMGCPPNSLLRFQTNATADGNVAGWSGSGVTYNNSDGTFNIDNNIANESGTTKTTQKLIPSKTASDGINLSTGIVDIRTEFISNRINEVQAKLSKLQEQFDSPTVSQIYITNLPTLTYGSDQEVIDNLDTDINAAIESVGFDPEDETQDGFVASVKSLTNTIKEFFSGFFN